MVGFINKYLQGKKKNKRGLPILKANIKIWSMTLKRKP